MDGKAIVDRWRLDHWPHLRHDEIVGTEALVRAIDATIAQARAEKDAEIAKLTVDLDALRKEYVRLHLDLEVAYRGLGTKH